MKVQCPHCKKVLSVPDDYKGQHIKCASCNGVLMVTPAIKERKSQEAKVNPTKSNPTMVKASNQTINKKKLQTKCDFCGRKINKQAYLSDSNQVMCSKCYYEMHKATCERGIIPKLNPEQVLIRETCPYCDRYMWVRTSDVKQGINCLHCNGLFHPYESETSLLISIKTAIWIITIIIIVSIIIYLIACAIEAVNESNIY